MLLYPPGVVGQEREVQAETASLIDIDDNSHIILSDVYLHSICKLMVPWKKFSEIRGGLVRFLWGYGEDFYDSSPNLSSEVLLDAKSGPNRTTPNTTPEHALFRIYRCRQQFYASFIHRLIILRSRHVVSNNPEGNKFPRLSSLMVARSHPISRYQPYRQQALTHFSYFGRPSMQSGRSLAERCPRLLSLDISVPTSREDKAASKRNTDELVEFLRCSCLPLERLGISSLMLYAARQRRCSNCCLGAQP